MLGFEHTSKSQRIQCITALDTSRVLSLLSIILKIIVTNENYYFHSPFFISFSFWEKIKKVKKELVIGQSRSQSYIALVSSMTLWTNQIIGSAWLALLLISLPPQLFNKIETMNEKKNIYIYIYIYIKPNKQDLSTNNKSSLHYLVLLVKIIKI